MGHQDIINTHDQLVAAGSGIAIMRCFSIGRDHYLRGWQIYRMVNGQVLNTDGSTAAWYDHGRKVFSNFAVPGKTFHERQRSALALAQAWVAEMYGEVGPWSRNRLGDYVPTRIHKAFPLRRVTVFE